MRAAQQTGWARMGEVKGGAEGAAPRGSLLRCQTTRRAGRGNRGKGKQGLQGAAMHERKTHKSRCQVRESGARTCRWRRPRVRKSPLPR